MYATQHQDDFVDIALGRRKHGFFVDIGAGCIDPKTESNSFAFEERGWHGIAIDIDAERMKGRLCTTVICPIGDGQNGTRTVSSILFEHSCPKTVDYLSVDVDGLDFLAVKSFVEAGWRFKVATIEHDLYSQRPGTQESKNAVFSLLANQGYVRVVDNVGHKATIGRWHDGYPFEDWYIDPSVVDYKTLVAALRGSIL